MCSLRRLLHLGRILLRTGYMRHKRNRLRRRCNSESGAPRDVADVATRTPRHDTHAGRFGPAPLTFPPAGAASAVASGGPGRPVVGAPRSTFSALMSAPSRPTVIVADDDADMRAYIHHAIRGQAEVYEAADGAEALRLARALRPRLVVADIRMPGLDGHALCAALHADPVTRGVRVLLVSGEPPGTAGDCADGLLAKPFNAASLRARVGRLL